MNKCSYIYVVPWESTHKSFYCPFVSFILSIATTRSKNRWEKNIKNFNFIDFLNVKIGMRSWKDINFCCLSLETTQLLLFLWWGAMVGRNENFLLCICVLLSFYTVRRILTVSILEWFAFPSPVDHVFSEVSTMTGPSWVVLHGMAHSFTELHKPLHNDRAVIHEGENYHMTLKILLLGIFPKKSMIWKDTYTPVLAEALFIRAT